MSESEATASMEESMPLEGEKVKVLNGVKEMEEKTEVKLQNGDSEKSQINGDIEKMDDSDVSEEQHDDDKKDKENVDNSDEQQLEQENLEEAQPKSCEPDPENSEASAEGESNDEEIKSELEANDDKVCEPESTNDVGESEPGSESKELSEDDLKDEIETKEEPMEVDSSDATNTINASEKEKEQTEKDKENGDSAENEVQIEKTEESEDKTDVSKESEEKDSVLKEKEEEKGKEGESKGVPEGKGVSTKSVEPVKGKKGRKDKSDEIQEVLPTRQLRVRRTPRKYTDDDDDIKIEKEVIKDDSSDIEMIEESDPLAISDADVKKAQQKEKKEIKTKDPNVIIIDTNTLLKNQGNLAAAVAQSSTSVSLVSTPPAAIATATAATATASTNVSITASATAVSNVNIQTAIQAITGGVPAQGLQSAYITALQQVSEKVLLAQGGQVPMNSQHLAQLQQYYNSLGHLQDDAYVIEAPSFIVPYVMEGKPKEPIKAFLKRINKELTEYEKKEEEERKKKEEEGKKEKEKLDVEAKEKEDKTEEEGSKKEEDGEEKKELAESGTEEKEETENKDDEAKKIDEKETDEKITDEKITDEKITDEKITDEKITDEKITDDKITDENITDENITDENITDEKKTDDEKETDEKVTDEKITDEKITDEKEMDEKKTDDEKSTKSVDEADQKDENKENTNKEENKESKTSESEKENNNKKEPEKKVSRDDDKENKEKSDTESVVDLEREEKKTEDLSHLGKWEPYYRSTLGKFILDLGLNQAQEFLQSDLLRMQKKKIEKMKTAPSKEGIISVKILERQLELTRKKNSHLRVPLKICKFCNFKTESEMVMDRHLESPHMVNYTYKCNFCEFETRGPQVILFHMEAEHNIRGRLERAPAFFQCSLCPYEDNNKSKMTRHSFSCSKKYKPEKNCELADWEPPAKIPKVHRGRPNTLGKAFEPVKMPNLLPKGLAGMNISLQSAVAANLLTTASANTIAGRGRGRPVGSYKTAGQVINQGRGASPGSLLYSTRGVTTTAGNLVQQVGGNTQQFTLGNQMFHSTGRVPRILPSSSASNVSLIPGLAASSSITIQARTPIRINPSPQSVQSKAGNTKSPQQPSISITPLPRGGGQQPQNVSKGTTPTRDASGKPSFVICEICDGYIKDLEQLRNHMNLIHKVKIHPKMIYNRPPLNCQKCQHRFFTDQGLERHLLGTHGLVTSSMQEAANKGKDAGRCPICGKVFQWKLLNHVSRDHKMTLKPAHLSYKCTVCTATFNMYRLFENHVYSAHSVVNKNKGDANKKQSSGGSGSSDPPLKINDEITIIPQPAAKGSKSDNSVSSGKKSGHSPSVSKEITITKVGSRPTRRSAGNSVEVISLDESPKKAEKRANKDSAGNSAKKTRVSS